LVAVFATVVGVAVWNAYRWNRASKHLAAARQALASFRYDEAYAQSTGCFPYYRNDPNVILLAVQCARRSGHVDEARNYLDLFDSVQRAQAKSADLDGREEAARLEHQLLLAQEGKASDFATQALWERAEAGDHHREMILEALVQGAMRTYRGGQARAAIDAWMKTETRDPRAYLFKGMIYNQMYRKGDDAVRGFQEALSIDPDYHDARLALADLLLDAADGDAAEPHYRYVHERKPGAATLLGLGRCRAAAGDYATAEKLLRDALRSEPENSTITRELGIVLMQNGLLEEAHAHLVRTLETWPHDVPTSYNLYLVLQRLQRDAAAAQQLERHKSLESKQKVLNRLLFTELQQRPNDPEVMFELGKTQLQIGGAEYDSLGLWWLQRVLQIDPFHKGVYGALADYYQRQNNREMAERCRRLAEP
jgi:tetratricopeptide (TPR) repeat protein